MVSQNKKIKKCCILIEQGLGTVYALWHIIDLSVGLCQNTLVEKLCPWNADLRLTYAGQGVLKSLLIGEMDN